MRWTLLAAVVTIILGEGATAWGQFANHLFAQNGTALRDATVAGGSHLQPAPATPMPATVPTNAVAAGPAYLGVQINEVAGSGLVVGHVTSQGPCDVAGLRAGDMVRAANEQSVRTLADMNRIRDSLAVGSRLRLIVLRAGAEQTIEITATERPGSPQTAIAARNRGLGVTIGPVTPAARQWAGTPDLRGAVVTGLYTGAPAHRAHIPNHAVIVALDGREVASPAELRAAVASAEPTRAVAVRYYAAGRLTETNVVLEPASPTAVARSTLQPTYASLTGRVASNVVVGNNGTGSTNTSATGVDHTAQTVRELQQQVLELKHKVDLLEARMGVSR